MANVPLYIGGRYLFAKKSRNVINVISAICVGGIAVGVAALVIIMSVYNGFEDLIRRSLGSADPDLKVSAAEGKVFAPDSVAAIDRIYDLEGVESVSKTLEEQVFVVYGQKQTLALALGVDRRYEESTFPLLDIYGTPALDLGQQSYAGISKGVAETLGGIYLNTQIPVEIWFPSRHRGISASKAAESLNSISLVPGSVFTAGSEYDNRLILLPIDDLRGLLEYDGGEVSSLNIRLKEGTSVQSVQSRIKEILGPSFKVQDRVEQNASLFRMMKYEKLAIFLILIAVVIIVAFSITGCLSMLIIEKKKDIRTLISLGARDSLVRRIFVTEGSLIALLGLAIGLVLGIAAVVLQQQFGFISMPGALSATAYPVRMNAGDILAIIGGVSVTGWAIAYFTSRQIREYR